MTGVSHQVINGTIKDLQLYTSCYNPLRRAATRSNVLHPVTISLAGSTPEDRGLHLDLLVTDIRLSVSPSTIELLNRISVTFTQGATKETDTVVDTTNYSTLWDQKGFNDLDFWFLKTGKICFNYLSFVMRLCSL